MPSLQSFSTFGLNASCNAIERFSDVQTFLSLYDKNKTTYLLGGGSNTIFADDFNGTILLNQIKGKYIKLYSFFYTIFNTKEYILLLIKKIMINN